MPNPLVLGKGQMPSLPQLQQFLREAGHGPVHAGRLELVSRYPHPKGLPAMNTSKSSHAIGRANA